ncbi:NDMA-dependent alcohol dehydrogenase [Microbacterium sp. zg.B48]|uniref:NDMA-dependent alcohol dehydrogenase n=1 Tax=unclassified Microbacterium TaxID=2609290 RepID=UPI00214C1E7E|nr:MULTISPECIES: NDMA-dependent alcohol dehydrogenase [unclassified Microbacterium]MCR2765067.1 NDMA-dependent alcohol dehydrogenase [Microbacterium sp. zg.B48]MCR2811246.1 NDMA-dependent alcohol dehydrogenase [Microbacterium sp. zg.B185]WIM19845.1 NDMA-dependent alcohol dehydrogenase [Microbacterium sp. zg-B185]
MSMTTRAAVCREAGQPWEITELELDDPRANEVRIKFYAAGMCHSDDHIQKGDAAMRMPVVGGHEGAGIVDAIGDGVTRVQVGDHVVCSFIPACGKCRYCSTGRQNLCDEGKNASTGEFADGSFRFHQDGVDFGGLCVLGTFSQYAVVSEYSVIPIPKEIPFEVAALVGCAVPTGWGTAVHAAGVQAGETVVIFGAGGVGSNAVQGAALAGAQRVIVVDPVEFKRDMAKVFGATHTFETAEEATEFVVQSTWGELADHAIITVGVLHDKVIHDAINIVGKTGQVTITAVGAGWIDENPGMLIGYQRRIQGAIFGGCNPLHDVPKLLSLYQSGHLKLDELVTTKYKLEDINQGYQDMLDGKNIRGVIMIEH